MPHTLAHNTGHVDLTAGRHGSWGGRTCTGIPALYVAHLAARQLGRTHVRGNACAPRGSSSARAGGPCLIFSRLECRKRHFVAHASDVTITGMTCYKLAACV